MPAADFAKMVPGLDFLQGLLKNAGAGLPNMSQWIAPTLDPEELEKRIEQLRTVQFWLEQNARMLGTTIQALEVQRMTLSTLRTMNLPIDAIRESMTMKPHAASSPAPAPAAAAAPEPARGAARPPAEEEAGSQGGAAGDPAAAGAAPAVDAMQWWGALTRQFTDLAANALKEVPVDAARQLAEAMTRPAGAPAKAASKGPSKAPRKASRKPSPKAPVSAGKTTARKTATPGASARRGRSG